MVQKKYTFRKNVLMGEDEIKFLPIDKITQQTEDEFLFRFNVPINHDPGQFFQCSLLGIGESAISICSYSKDYFEMSIRAVGNVTKKLCNMKAGDKMGLRGPYGRGYPISILEGNNVVIIAGGSGVAPVRGIIEYINKHRNKFGNVNLFFGFRTKDDILFENDFEKWEKNNMYIDLALSQRKSHPTAIKGYVTHSMENHIALESNENKVAFVCGPPVMIRSTCDKLIKEKGFNPDQIYLSEERHMKCGVGRCGHCMIKGKYCCTDGPVFRYNELY